MGLDTSHNAWHGAYSAFMTWRKKIAEVAGLPPLELMEGFYDPLFPNERMLPTLYAGVHVQEYTFGLKELDRKLPIKWESLKPSALHILLYHSDCDGEIGWQDCKPLADELMKLLDKLPDENVNGHIGNWREKTQTFINGLLLAYKEEKNLNFH
jgi:hypothetical protein